MQLVVVNGQGKRSLSSTSILAVRGVRMIDAGAFAIDAKDAEPALGMADQCA